MHGRNGFTPTQAKIVFHLAPLAQLTGSYLQPQLVTQDGIASSVGIARNHIPQAINDLIANGLITARKARVDGASRRKTCYFLTQGGLQTVREPVEPPTRREKPQQDRELFVGRRRELKELASWLEGSAPLLVLEGERGIGKTALLKRLKARTTKNCHYFYWSLAHDGSLRGGLISLANGLPDGQGRMLAYVLRTEQLVNHARVVSLLDEVRTPLVLALDDADASGARADTEALANAFTKARRAKLLLAGESINAPGGCGRLHVGALSRAETERLARMLGRGDPAEAYESSGGKPMLVEMWSPGAKGVGVLATPTKPISKKEASVLDKLMLFGRPVHVGEAAALGIDYQSVSWLAGKGLVAVANGRIHPFVPNGMLPRTMGSRRKLSRARVAGAILATWNDPAHDAEACAHYLDAGDDEACGKVVAEKGERMLKAGLACQLEEVLAELKTDKLDPRTMARVLTVIGTLKKIKGVWEDALDCFEKARALLEADDSSWAESTARIASVHLARRDITQALKTYDEALSRLPPGQPRIEARIRDEMATTLLRKGDTSGAASFSEMAVSRAGESGDKELIGLCEATRGNVFLVSGALTDAERCFTVALAKVRAGSNIRAEGTILINLATAKHRRGDVEAALALWKESTALLERHGDPRYCMALANLSSALWHTGDWAGSVECRERALSLASMVNDKSVEGAMLAVSGDEALLSGRVDEAVDFFKSALEIKSRLPDKDAELRGRCDVSRAFVAAGSPEKALEVLKSDIDWAKSAGPSGEASMVLLVAARARMALGDASSGRDTLKPALAACPQGDKPSTARVLRMLGVCAAVDGVWYVAKRYLEDALSLFKESGEAVESTTTLHDISCAFKRLGLVGADAAMDGASDSARKIGMTFPPANSDWLLVCGSARARPG